MPLATAVAAGVKPRGVEQPNDDAWRSDPRAQIAIHEGAHALIAYLLNTVIPVSASIVPADDGTLGRVTFRSPSDGGDTFDNVTMRLCAGIAQRQFLGDLLAPVGDGPDRQQATDLCLLASDEPALDYSRASKRARSLVAQHWEAILIVARALLRHETLDEPALHRIINLALLAPRYSNQPF